MDEFSDLISGSVPLSLDASPSSSSAFESALFSSPQLVILNHYKTLSDEVVSKNGIQRMTHVVVKGSPFSFQLGVAGAKIDFNQLAFDAQLVYDTEGSKQVDYIKQKPLECKFVPVENGQKLEAEFRIKVLTSQHEDMLFKIRIQGYEPISKEPIQGLTITSSPIKVISKPEQAKKGKSSTSPGKKRSLNDMLIETIHRIESKQEEQQRLIAKLLQQQSQTSTSLQQKKSKFLEIPQDNVAQKKKDDKKAQFEEAFQNMIQSFIEMNQDAKPTIIREIIRKCSPRQTQYLSEILDLFWTEGLQKEMGNSSRDKDSQGCSCSSCPHKLELNRIDNLYNEFLMTEIPPPFQDSPQTN